ncbi:Concanavalin A-like lectin/glucanases superfamily protein [Prauserella marina]|uniref:Concanavalin A-like lectin/glucanases superfamily protein n=1 Tax=Prauserella marina TaxID=530584 RepID=A0A1G6LR46_9PSEU|nr:LamG-like jellyroll fold domain-containing protein [Prauserella marina]PWV85782.1 concanavalin A-like lectin/glucanase superfamily protein [Prauserella marina]SDC45679.1 Concanavalin A-like lectin/glucanases superfamily protein [Prauserella marina]
MSLPGKLGGKRTRRASKVVRTGAALAAVLVGASLAVPVAHASPGKPAVFPTLAPHLVSYYDFDHPVAGNPGLERDLGRSGTDLELINGAAAMRVADNAYPGARKALQTKQIDESVAGNDDWKAGVYSPGGVPTLNAFNATTSTTVMGWFKMTGDHPKPDSTTPDPGDYFNAVGLAGILAGNSDGHGVRALLELINVDGELRLVALGRRLDDGRSQTFAASQDWQRLLPKDEWVFLAATFDFDKGTMALYRNGKPVPGFYTETDDPWEVGGTPGPHRTSATDPRGIKIGGSFPQNTLERNPCECRFDGLMFLDKVASPAEVAAQYRWMARGNPH